MVNTKGIVKDMDDLLTILVCSSDNYDDLWFPFFKLLNHYWSDNNCEIILNTESKNYQFQNLRIKYIERGKVFEYYGERMLFHLDFIKTKYTLLLLDDFFIRREVDRKEIGKILSWLEDNDCEF